MGKEVLQIVVGVVVVIALLAVVRGSLRSTMVETVTAPSATPSGVMQTFSVEGGRVRGANQSSGTSLFGLGWGGSTSLTIEFQVTDECWDSIAVGDEWPSLVAGCESAVPVEGEVTRRRQGGLYGGLLAVEMPVSKGCFAVAAGGGLWPSGLPECSSEEGR